MGYNPSRRRRVAQETDLAESMRETAFSIPSFNDHHLIPPFLESAIARQPRSPYHASSSDFVKRFSFSPDRIAILKGLLEYRRLLHERGFNQGFHWLAGSFVEDILRLENREPRDIDVVTVFYPPETYRSVEAKQGLVGLFSTKVNKPKYRCDTYQIDLGIVTEGDLPSLRSIIEQANYWSGLFSHRRTTAWKGIVQVELGTLEEDRMASQYLQEVEHHGP